MSARGVLILVNLLGGAAVLASYAQGMSSPHTASGAIWGGVPESARGLYTVSMFAAAIGYFPFTYLFAFYVDPSETRFMGARLSLVSALYALVLVASALWLPLTSAYLDAPSAAGWLGIKTVLAGAALGSIGLFACLLRVEPRPPTALWFAAIAGCLCFCFQTVVLDACIWVLQFPS